MIQSKLDPTIKMIVFDKDGEKVASHITFLERFFSHLSFITNLNPKFPYFYIYTKVHLVTVHHPCITGVPK